MLGDSYFCSYFLIADMLHILAHSDH